MSSSWRQMQACGRLLRLHAPLLRVVASSLLSFAAVASLHFEALATSSPISFSVALLVGFAYTQLFEYLYHRYLMHEIWGPIRRTHLTHHRVFHGNNYATRSEKDLQHVAGRWFLFPPCFAVHYFLARIATDSELVVAILAGCTLHYLVFEISHWFAHVEDNLFDRVIGRIPLLGSVRAVQLAHHRLHHERPNANFNFNTPYLGDVLGRTVASTSGNLPLRTGGHAPDLPSVPDPIRISG